jgi:hypothetical protein
MSKPASREEESLKRLAVLLLLISVLLVGCGGKKSVVGSWKVEPTSIKGDLIDKMPDSESKAQMKAAFSSARFTFKEDGTVSMSSTMGSTTQSGKWSMNGDAIDVTMGPSTDGPKPSFTMSADGSKIHMAQQSMMEMDLVRTE